MKAKPTRRLVTGHRAAGNAPTLLWVTDERPASVDGGADRAARDIGEDLLQGQPPQK